MSDDTDKTADELAENKRENSELRELSAEQAKKINTLQTKLAEAAKNNELKAKPLPTKKSSSNTSNEQEGVFSESNITSFVFGASANGVLCNLAGCIISIEMSNNTAGFIFGALAATSILTTLTSLAWAFTPPTVDLKRKPLRTGAIISAVATAALGIALAFNSSSGTEQALTATPVVNTIEQNPAIKL